MIGRYSVTAPDVEKRQPVSHLNYRGNLAPAIAEQIESRVPFGPTTIGEWVWPVEALYDVKADRTRVGVSYMPPPVPGMAASDALGLLPGGPR